MSPSCGSTGCGTPAGFRVWAGQFTGDACNAHLADCVRATRRIQVQSSGASGGALSIETREAVVVEVVA